MRGSWKKAALFGMVSVVPVAVLFLIWQGLTPPLAQEYTGTGFKPQHVVFAFGYLSIVFLLLCPHVYRQLTLKEVSCVIPLSLFLNVFLVNAKLLPLGSLLGHAPDQLKSGMAIGFGAGFVFIALVAFYLLLKIIWRNRDNVALVVYGLSLIALLLTTLKVTHLFSSRYAVAAFPLAVLVVAPFFRISIWHICLGGLGAMLGFVTLHKYYMVH